MQSTIQWPSAVGGSSRRTEFRTPSTSRSSTPEPPTTPDQPIPDPLAEPPPVIVCPDCTSEKDCRRHVFRFLDLPTELRLNVYQKALLRTEAINLARKLPPVIQKLPDIVPRNPGMLMMTPTGRRRSGDANEVANSARCDINIERNKYVPKSTKDPLSVQIFLLCRQVCHEALPVLYRENAFNLHLEFSILPLTNLRQRTRSLIKHAIISVHEHSEVVNGGFDDIFVNGLRYCFGLQKLEIVTKVPMSRDRGYDLNFHILRWLPKSCVVEVKGERISDGVKKMVDEQNMLARKLDLVSGSTSLPAYMTVSTYAGSPRSPQNRRCTRHEDEPVTHAFEEFEVELDA